MVGLTVISVEYLVHIVMLNKLLSLITCQNINKLKIIL